MRLALLPALIMLAFTPLAQAQTPAPATPTPAAAADKPLAVVNGKAIPALYGDLVKREMAQGQPDSPQLDARVRESLINLELLSRAALDKGLDKEPHLAAALDIRRKDQLAKAYLRITSRPTRSPTPKSRRCTTKPKRSRWSRNTRPTTFW